MTRNAWHILDDGETYVLARQLPPRFDVWAETRFPRCRKGRLAQQIRQDMWRAVQRVRGFSPVVRIAEAGDEFAVTAGGRVPRAGLSAQLTARIATVLEDPELRARWLRWARR